MERVLRGELQMRSIEVKREELLEKVEANKLKHIRDYEEAIIEFRKTASQKLHELAEQVAAGKSKTLSVSLPVPTSHEDDYDVVINMLKWESRDKVTVTTAEFESYVLDKWDWQRHFAETVSNYKKL